MGHPRDAGRAPSPVCWEACVSVFLWLCSQQCFGCASTVERGPTRYVLSETPAPPLGRGSASNPEAIFATICGHTYKQIRLITEDILIRLIKRRFLSPWGVIFHIQVQKIRVFSHLAQGIILDKLTRHLQASLGRLRTRGWAVGSPCESCWPFLVGEVGSSSGLFCTLFLLPNVYSPGHTHNIQIHLSSWVCSCH